MNELRYARHRFVCCFKVWGTQTLSQDHKYLHIQSEVPIFPTPNLTVNPTINIKPDLSDPTRLYPSKNKLFLENIFLKRLFDVSLILLSLPLLLPLLAALVRDYCVLISNWYNPLNITATPIEEAQPWRFFIACKKVHNA